MISDRAKKLKPSPTLALATKAKELKAQGNDVISLSVGEPDWDTFESVKEVGIQSIQNGETKYVPASGLPELRGSIAKQTNSDLGTDYSPGEVTVTSGGKFVIFSFLQATVNPGDEVLIPAPYWVSYPTQVELADGIPKIVKASNGSRITAQELEAAITKKSKVLILNSPSNPTGSMYSDEELKELGEVLKRHPNIIVMSDDIYNRLVFKESGLAPHLLKVCPDLKNRTLIVNGISKTYSMTGWRLGWALGPAEIIGAMNKYQSQSVSCAAGFTQRAAIAAINDGQEELKKSLKLLKTRRDFVFQKMGSIQGIEVEEPQGAFYIWPNISQFFGKSWNGKKIEGSSDFAKSLLEDQMVAVVPGNEFGSEGFIRVSYALNEVRMGEAIDRIQNFINQLQ